MELYLNLGAHIQSQDMNNSEAYAFRDLDRDNLGV